METKKDNSKKFILIIVILALVCAVGVFAAFHMGQNSMRTETAEATEAAEDANGIKIADDASDWDNSLTDTSDQETKGIKIPGYGELTVAANETDWKITLANPQDNDCYFKYLITIDDSEEVIYESDYIEPGKAIREFQVTKGLEAGDYKIHLNIEAYSTDGSNTRLNGANVQADLHVVG